jgi:hypothetical protein
LYSVCACTRCALALARGPRLSAAPAGARARRAGQEVICVICRKGTTELSRGRDLSPNVCAVRAAGATITAHTFEQASDSWGEKPGISGAESRQRLAGARPRRAGDRRSPAGAC